MYIKRVECDQFAGIKLADGGVKFDKGLNLVVGNNESGKSTMADLIFYMLFKDSKLDGRTDAAFVDKYFPKNANGPAGNFIDGVLEFETEEGGYKLKKEWEKGEESSRLTLPDGTMIKGDEEIKEVLKNVLQYRKGVYDQIVFATQKREGLAVPSIMKELSKKSDELAESRKDLLSVLAKASLETGGVSIEKLEAKLAATLEELAFRWDFKADMPEQGVKRGIDHKWSISEKNDGILRAYYDMEEVRRAQKNTSEAEKQVDEYKKQLLDLKEKRRAVENERNDFQKYRSVLTQNNLLSGTVEERAKTIKESEETLAKWPGIITDIETARTLLMNRDKAIDKELYQKAKEVEKRCSSCKEEFEKKKEVNRNEIRRAGELINQQRIDESKLSGMNIVAKINKLGDVPVELRSLSSGSVLSDTEGEVAITEASVIAIPDIAEITLMPKGIDVEEIKTSLDSCRNELGEIYEKYGVKELEELEKLAGEYENAKKNLEDAEAELKKVLGERTLEELEAANRDMGEEMAPLSEINGKLADICGAKSPDSYIGGLEAILESYEKKYGSIAEITEQLSELTRKQDEDSKKLESLKDIPEKYMGIENPDGYDEELQGKLKDYDGLIQTTDNNMRTIERNLGDKTAEEYNEELLEKTRLWEEKKTQYAHWAKIYEVFCTVKETTGGNPALDLEKKFREYLSLLTDDGVKLESLDEQLSVKLTSGKYELTYDTLSAGTEDTVSLAFRLAMLEHLYPEGDGLALFDDPFTDMDANRVGEACKLLRKFAENNQVIFITCDDKYRELIGGNVVEMGR